MLVVHLVIWWSWSLCATRCCQWKYWIICNRSSIFIEWRGVSEILRHWDGAILSSRLLLLLALVWSMIIWWWRQRRLRRRWWRWRLWHVAATCNLPTLLLRVLTLDYHSTNAVDYCTLLLLWRWFLYFSGKHFLGHEILIAGDDKYEHYSYSKTPRSVIIIWLLAVAEIRWYQQPSLAIRHQCTVYVMHDDVGRRASYYLCRSNNMGRWPDKAASIPILLEDGTSHIMQKGKRVMHAGCSGELIMRRVFV